MSNQGSNTNHKLLHPFQEKRGTKKERKDGTQSILKTGTSVIQNNGIFSIIHKALLHDKQLINRASKWSSNNINMDMMCVSTYVYIYRNSTWTPGCVSCMNSNNLFTTVFKNFQWALRNFGYCPTTYLPSKPKRVKIQTGNLKKTNNLVLHERQPRSGYLWLSK